MDDFALMCESSDCRKAITIQLCLQYGVIRNEEVSDPEQGARVCAPCARNMRAMWILMCAHGCVCARTLNYKKKSKVLQIIASKLIKI